MKKLIFIFLVWMNIGVQAQKTEFKIIEKPISYTQERVNLSLEYLKDHHGLVQTSPTIIPKMIVLHYTAAGTVESNFRYFNNL